jgi:predicted ArsR family transcriptional regulator
MAGRKKETPDAAFLLAFLADPAPVLVSAEVGESVGMTRQGAHSRLEELEERGLVDSDIKSGTRVWWLSESGAEYAAKHAQASGSSSSDSSG